MMLHEKKRSTNDMNPHKNKTNKSNRSDIKCSRRVSTSCCTSGTRHIKSEYRVSGKSLATIMQLLDTSRKGFP